MSASSPAHRLAQVRETYDLVAENYAALVSDTSAEEPLDRAILTEFAARLVAGGIADVLDAGCGPGRMAPSLRAAGLRVVGIDLAPAMAQISRRTHGVPTAAGSIGALPLRDAVVGGVLAWYSIIHTEPDDLPAVFDEFHRVLQPGGLVLLGFQAGRGPRHIANAYGHDIDLDASLHEPVAVSAQLFDCGFEVLATLVRAPNPPYRLPQAMVLAGRRGLPAGPDAQEVGAA